MRSTISISTHDGGDVKSVTPTQDPPLTTRNNILLYNKKYKPLLSKEDSFTLKIGEMALYGKKLSEHEEAQIFTYLLRKQGSYILLHPGSEGLAVQGTNNIEFSGRVTKHLQD